MATTSMLKFNIIYALQDPNTYEIRYIGLSSKGLLRPLEHFKRYTTKKIAHYPIYRWIKKLARKNQVPKIIVLQEFEDKKFLQDAEIYWISYFKSINSPLLNCTNGGDGVKNRIIDDNFRKKISIGTKKWWDTLDINIKNRIKENNLTGHGKEKIKLIDQHGNVYESMTDAAKQIKCNISAISIAIKKNRPCKGYILTKVGI